MKYKLTSSQLYPLEDRRKAMKWLMKAKEMVTTANDSYLSDSELSNLDKYLNSIPDAGRGNMPMNTAIGNRTGPDQESVVSESTTIGTAGTSTNGTHSELEH